MNARRGPPRSACLGSVAVLLGLLVLVAAPVGLAAQRKSQSLPTLRLGYYSGASAGLARSLDPALIDFPLDAETIALVDANLVHVLPSGQVAGDLASHWAVSKNRLVYTFTLRKNAQFSNGHHVTAHDVAFSLQRALAASTKSPIALNYLGLIRGARALASGKAHTLSGVKVVGRQIVQITITRPAGYFLETLAYPAADVLDPAAVAGKAVGRPNAATGVFEGNYLTTTCSGNQGAGPFEFLCRDRSSSVHSFYAGTHPAYTLVPNPYYYGSKPHLRIELPEIDSDQHAYKRYLTGTLDTSTIPTAYLSHWQGKSTEMRQFPSSVVTYLVPNTHLPPFNNIHCRRAVAYAIDRTTIANVLHGTQRPTYAVVPKGMLGYYSGDNNPHYNLSRARAELALCPSRTDPVRLTFPTASPDAVNEFSVIGTDLRTIGMNVTLQPLETSRWFSIAGQSLDKSGTQIAEGSWAQDYPDPHDYLFLLLHSGVPFNVGGWRNASYDRLVDRADGLSAPGARATLYRQAQHIALTQGAMIPLTNWISYELVKPYVHGLVGTEAYVTVVPRGDDWANVSISKH